MNEILPRLGVNIDHVATLRQLRGTPYPDLIKAARAVEEAGASQITVHLREDRRHIHDEDVKRLRAALKVPMNLEMATSEEIVKYALKIQPAWSCLVPEKRQEVTTEGGLNLDKNRKKIEKTVERLKKAGIQVSLFIEPSLKAVELSYELGADAVEFHTGRYCLATQEQAKNAKAKERAKKRAEKELERLAHAAMLANKLGIQAHAGHGFDYENVRAVAQLEDGQGASLIEEYNIGHAIICRAVLVGLQQAVREMVMAISSP